MCKKNQNADKIKFSKNKKQYRKEFPAVDKVGGERRRSRRGMGGSSAKSKAVV